MGVWENGIHCSHQCYYTPFFSYFDSDENQLLCTGARCELIKTQCLFIINLATQAEWKLFNSFGEIEETLVVLSELKTVGDEAVDAFSRLSSLQLKVASTQPEISPALAKLVIESKDRIEIRIPAWQRSIEEILLDWRLSS